MLDKVIEIDGDLPLEEKVSTEMTIENIRQNQAMKLNDAASGLNNSEEQHQTSISMFRRAMKLCPDLPHPKANLGLWLFRNGQREEGLRYMEEAVRLVPDKDSYLGNLGVSYNVMGRYEESIELLERSIKCSDKPEAAMWDLSLTYLKRGDWETGLKGYEIRFRHRGMELYPQFPVPFWKGEDLNGKVLYVQGEQGIGDRILLSRYLAWVKEKYPSATIRVCFAAVMTSLFWEFTKHGIELLPPGIPWQKDTDYALWLSSMPYLHGTRPDNIPSDPGWITERLDAEDIQCSLPQPDLKSLKIGIAWTGNPVMLRNRDRSIPLKQLLPLTEDPRIQLYNFQCGAGYEEFQRLSAGTMIVDIAPEIEKEGLVGTALALREMDLVITVCTSIAHLAGAVGVPCWTLLCADPYWIWGTKGETTPWYPNMKLYRQTKLDDWTTVIAAVQKDLTHLLYEKGL